MKAIYNEIFFVIYRIFLVWLDSTGITEEYDSLPFLGAIFILRKGKGVGGWYS